MGFQRKRKIYKLDFSETEYEGLEVEVSGLTTGEYLDFLVLSSGAEGTGNNSSETQEMLTMLANHIVSWNLEDENGNAVPISFEGLKTNELSLNMLMVDSWVQAISGVSNDTGKESLPGSNPLVESIPMETL